MKRTTVFLDEGLERDLKALAARKGEPAASLVREALGEYVARHHPDEPRLGFLAAGRSGRSDGAETHEDLLWQDLAPHGASGEARRTDRGRGAGARKKTRPAPKPPI
jgi:predicted transcriptional regulator